MTDSRRRGNAPSCRAGVSGLLSQVSCLLSLVSYLLLTGCVRRALTIRSEPPGAQVFLNNHLKGETPLTYDFEWYGWYRVTLRKEGYERLDDHKPLRSPAFLWIPLDLVFELLPVEIWDRQTWSYTLVPATPLPTPSPPPLTTTAPASPESAGVP